MSEAVRVRDVLEDGGVVLEWQDSGETTTAVLSGIQPVQPLPLLYREIVAERLGATRGPVLAERRGAVGDRTVVRLLAFSWQDKSGDVYEDVAEVLVREGLAEVADGDFPERAAYEAAARDRRR